MGLDNATTIVMSTNLDSYLKQLKRLRGERREAGSNCTEVEPEEESACRVALNRNLSRLFVFPSFNLTTEGQGFISSLHFDR